MTYDEALARIHGLEGRAWRDGLDRMQSFVERAGLLPALTERGYVHVAGTNGKGTTTAFVEAILRGQGWRTGAFYSPFVVDYRERIQAQGRMIEKEELGSLVERLMPLADAMAETPFGGATKFELEVSIGLAYWQQRACDWVALEVGLGGRLDATNVVVPRACAIVSIGLDHTSILGNTVERIAAEKAGIVKSGIPVVLGEMPLTALRAIETIATERAAPVWRVGREVTYQARPDGSMTLELPGHRLELHPTLPGSRTPHNVAVALAACFAAGAIRDQSLIAPAVRDAWLPGRFDRRMIEGRQVVFDGAHNADAALALQATLPAAPLRLVTNMLAGHEVEAFYRGFQDRAVWAEVAPIASPRAMTVEEAVARLETIGIPARGHDTVVDAMAAALAGDPRETILVTGSNYLVGEALRLVG